MQYTYFFPENLLRNQECGPQSMTYVLAMNFYRLRYLFHLKAVDVTFKFRGDRG
jgi:hypothetical protein